MTRDDFMEFIRDEDKLNTLSTDDRIEVFCTILQGSSDLTKDLLDAVLSDYNVPNLEVVEELMGWDSNAITAELIDHTRSMDAYYCQKKYTDERLASLIEPEIRDEFSYRMEKVKEKCGMTYDELVKKFNLNVEESFRLILTDDGIKKETI